MPYYESVFIVRQDIPAAQVESLAANMNEIVTKNGGKVTKTEHWGLKTLAYKIKKNRKGHYVHFNIDAPPVAVIELERNLRFNEDVLRFLTVKVDELEAGPSCMMKRHEERSDNEYGGDRGFGGSGRAPRRERAEPETEGN